MTIKQLDESIMRPDGRGAAVKAGHIAYVVADGDRRDYGSHVVSRHRTESGARRSAARNGCVVWQWDPYMGTSGGYRAMGGAR